MGLHRLFWLLAGSKMLYRLCRNVVDRHLGDNNDDILTNGEFRLMRAVLPSATVVFDVGANRGDWTALALKINPSAQYWCFEPSGATCELLRALSLPGRVVIENMGLGEREAQAVLYISESGSGGNSLHERWTRPTKSGRTETVSLVTLDGYCSHHHIAFIDLVKLDVEGHELHVLRGARRMLAEGRLRRIQFEYGGTYLDAGTRLKDVCELVRGLNPHYRLSKILPGGLRPIERYEQSFETFQYSNWVFELCNGAG